MNLFWQNFKNLSLKWITCLSNLQNIQQQLLQQPRLTLQRTLQRKCQPTQIHRGRPGLNAAQHVVEFKLDGGSIRKIFNKQGPVAMNVPVSRQK